MQNHKISTELLVVPGCPGLGALLLVLGAALGLGGLPRHLLLDSLALLPGDQSEVSITWQQPITAHLVTGEHLRAVAASHCSSSTYLVTVAGTLLHTSSGTSLQTSRGLETSLQTYIEA